MVPASLIDEKPSAGRQPRIFGRGLDARLGDEAGRLAALRRYMAGMPSGDQSFVPIVEMVRTICEVPSAAISLVGSDRIWFLSRTGLDIDEASREISFCTHTIARRGALIVPDARQDALFGDNPLVADDPQVVAYAGVPLTSPDGYNVGALCAVDYRPRHFSSAQVDSLHKLAAMVVDQLEWHQIEQRDPLTHAMSRRAFLAAADNLIWQRDWCSLSASLVLFDIDDFGALNARHGHSAGDTVLRRIVRDDVSSEFHFDEIARLGGGRFAMLRVGEVGSRAFDTAETMRAGIAALRFDTLPGTAITASFGIAEVDADTHDAAAWLAAAQHWLTEAKHAGGNRCGIDPRSLPRA